MRYNQITGAALAACTVGYAAVASAQSYTIISVSVDPAVTSPLEKVDTVVQAGSDPRNRFVWHRVRRVSGEQDSDSDSDSDSDCDGDSDSEKTRGAIILIASTYANFKQYMLNENGNAMESLAAHLASKRIEVHGYSPRTSMLAPGACSSGAVDCSIMSTWGFQTYLDDINFIRKRIDKKIGKPVIGGFSLGGTLGFAAVNADPKEYSGLLAWDSMILSSNPETLEITSANCAFLTDAVAGGFTFDEDTPGFIKFVASEGEQFTAEVFGSAIPSFGAPNFILLRANDAFTQLKYSHFPRFQVGAFDLNDVESNALNRDEFCSYAGDRTFSGNLKQFKRPILAIKEGFGYGPYSQESIDLTRSHSVTILSDPDFGHADRHNNADQAGLVKGPLVDWLENVVFAND